MVAADTLASYGSLARFEGVTRIAKVGISKDTLLAAGGDYSDYQMILKMVEQKAVADFAADDGSSLSPKAMHHWLTRVMYNRRSKMDPLWNSVIITGFRDGKAYLGSSDLYGTMFEDDFVATGLGGHLALPLIRKAWHAEMSEEEARKLLVDCMRVLFYRDTRASASIQVGTVSAEGSNVGEPFKLDTFWECAAAPPSAEPRCRCRPPRPRRPAPPLAPPHSHARAHLLCQASRVPARRRPPRGRLLVSPRKARGRSSLRGELTDVRTTKFSPSRADRARCFRSTAR